MKIFKNKHMLLFQALTLWAFINIHKKLTVWSFMVVLYQPFGILTQTPRTLSSIGKTSKDHNEASCNKQSIKIQYFGAN